LVRAHTFVAVLAFVCAWLLDILASTKLYEPEILPMQPWLSTGRVWNAYSHGMLYGWLGNAFFAFLYYAVPRLASRAVTSRGLGWLLFVLWNFGVVIPGWALLQGGMSLPPQWGDATLVLDGVATLALLLACIQFLPPLFRAGLSTYSVAGWYIVAGLLLGLAACVLDRLLPHLVPDVRSFSEQWWQDAIGLFVAPLGLAIAYVVVPAATGQSICCLSLAMVSFLLYFLAYPFTRAGDGCDGSVGHGAQTWFIIANICVAVSMILNALILLRSIRRPGGHGPRDVPSTFLRFAVDAFWVVGAFVLIQLITPFEQWVQFTDWASARSALWWIGFASFAAIGGLLYTRQASPGLGYNRRLAAAGFLVMALGLCALVIDLALAGRVQAASLQSDSAWLDSVRASQPYWWVRTAAEGVILVGFFAVILSMVSGPHGRAATAPADSPGSRFESGHSSLARAALPGIAITISLVMLVMPVVRRDRAARQSSAEAAPTGMPVLAENELRGREIYLREGCANCHTQFVRPTVADKRRFGVPTQPWELMADPPPVTGSHRVGPDLARERGRKSRDWQLVHLWDPRWVVPGSNMPRFPWLFSGDVNKPTTEALDLLAYLESLGRGIALAGMSEPGAATEPIKAPADATEPDLAKKGAELFVQNCSGCHGPHGDGSGPAAEYLLPSPRALPTACFSDAALSEVLTGGRPGSSMPSWRELPMTDRRALATYVRSLGPDLDRDVNAVAEAGFPPPGKGQPVCESAVGLTEADTTKARGLYQQNCQACHGADGGGNTTAVSTVLPTPTPFRRVRPTEAYAIDVINNGVPGTAMTPWREKLSEEDRLLLARYVRSLFTRDRPGD
jgi:cbb3-type cytochrome oxidase cytochrome c subunit/cbb3-type cytochrome oxidase subunit 1/cytochrome c2